MELNDRGILGRERRDIPNRRDRGLEIDAGLDSVQAGREKQAGGPTDSQGEHFEAKVDPIPPGATATLVREYTATKWEPGEYYFLGYPNSDSNYNDSKSVFDNFKSDLFTVAAP